MLRTGGPAYLTVRLPSNSELARSSAYHLTAGEQLRNGGYRYHPSRWQVLDWLKCARFAVQDEAVADRYWHLLAVAGP